MSSLEGHLGPTQNKLEEMQMAISVTHKHTPSCSLVCAQTRLVTVLRLLTTAEKESLLVELFIFFSLLFTRLPSYQRYASSVSAFPDVVSIKGGTPSCLELYFPLLLSWKVPNDQMFVFAARYDAPRIKLQAHHCICVAYKQTHFH